MDGISLGARDRPAVLHGVPQPQGMSNIFRNGGSPIVLRAARPRRVKRRQRRWSTRKKQSTGMAAAAQCAPGRG